MQVPLEKLKIKSPNVVNGSIEKVTAEVNSLKVIFSVNVSKRR